MAALDAALERARRGSGQVVGVAAEAGTGKSRLCAEFAERCRARGIPILEGRGVAHGKAIPMLPMLEMWRAFYDIRDGEGPETTRARIASRLLQMDESFREMLPYVFDLFGVPDPANPSPAIDPEQRQKRIHGVLKRILHDPAYGGLRVILLEDLHWFDGASDAYLETTVDSVPATRDLLLVTFRPGYQAPWMQRPHYQQLSLQPLDPEALRALLRDLLGEDPSVAALPEIIHARTKGNPFFIEEVVQSLVEGGQLAGGRGAYQLATPVEALQVPASVHAILSSRIDRLPEPEKELLQTAAVIGKTFSETLLGRVMASLTAIDDTALDPALSALVTAEFLYEAALYPQLEYSFKHPLTQEVAQRSQLRERRVRVHAAVAQALTEAGGNLDERAAEIARHWDEAGAPSKAARWHRHAAEWAGLSDPRESLRHWRRVRELAPGVEDAGERSNLAIHACDQILSVGWRMGGSEEEAAAAFAEGRALVESLGDRAALALLVGRYGLMRFSVAGSAGDYARYGEEAALLARDSGDPKLRAAIGTLPAYGHFHAGEGRAALEWSARVLEEVGSDNLLGKDFVGYSPRAGALHVRAQALMFLGRLTEARNQVGVAESVAEESRELEVFTWLQVTRALVEYTCGRAESGLEHGRRSLEIAEKLDNEASRMAAYAALGLANLVDGQPAAARDAFRESATIARDRRVVRALVPLVLAGLAEAHLALGEPTEAVATAREGIDLGNTGGCLYNEALAQLALAAALLARDCVGPRAEIESALERAEHLVASIEGRALSPRILELRGRLAAAVGDAPSSDRTFREALDLYRAIGATGHAERLARELDA
jgi:adenylate cyclase